MPDSPSDAWTLRRATEILTSKGKPIKELALLLSESTNSKRSPSARRTSRNQDLVISTADSGVLDDSKKFGVDHIDDGFGASSSSMEGSHLQMGAPTTAMTTATATSKKSKRNSLGASLKRKLGAVALGLGGGHGRREDEQSASTRVRSSSAAMPPAFTAIATSTNNVSTGPNRHATSRGHARSHTEAFVSVIPAAASTSTSAATAAASPISSPHSSSIPLTQPIPIPSSSESTKLRLDTNMSSTQGSENVIESQFGRSFISSSGAIVSSPILNTNPTISSSAFLAPSLSRSSSNHPSNSQTGLEQANVNESLTSNITQGEVAVPNELQQGVVMTRITAKNQKQLNFRIDQDQGQLVWESKKGKLIPIETIKEIRSGPDARFYREQFQLSSSYESRWISIIYVLNQSSYKSLHLIAPTRESFTLWDVTLKKMVAVRQELMSGIGHYEMREMMWEKFYWKSSTATDEDGGATGGKKEDITSRREGKLSFEEVEKMCRKLNIQSSTEDLRRWFNQSDTKERGYLDFEDFRKFVRCLKSRPEISRLHKKLVKEFGGRRHSIGATSPANLFDLTVFGGFMKEYQKSTLSTEELEALFELYSTQLPVSPSLSRSITSGSLSHPRPTSPVSVSNSNSQDESKLYQQQSNRTSISTSIPPPAAPPVPSVPPTTSVITEHRLSLCTQDPSCPSPPQPQTQRIMTVENFTSFLMSANNPAILPQDRKVWQDMTRPLSDYYISSSHNTYLVGHQLVGESTVEGYIRALLRSCRSVEVDIYDGDTEPVIFHGKTLTTKVSLREVCQAIKKYGFITSPYPIVISAEVHCGIQQQKLIADIMTEIFGHSLIRAPLEGRQKIEALPSPEELKGRIMFKTKNLYIASGRDTSWDGVGDSSTTTEASSSASESEGGLQQEQSRSFSAAIVERVQSMRKRKQPHAQQQQQQGFTPVKTHTRSSFSSSSPPPVSYTPLPKATIPGAQPERVGDAHISTQPIPSDNSNTTMITPSRTRSSSGSGGVGATAAHLIQKAIPSAIKPRPPKPPSIAESQGESGAVGTSNIQIQNASGSNQPPPMTMVGSNNAGVMPSAPASAASASTVAATSIPPMPTASPPIGFTASRSGSTRPPKMSLELLVLLVYTVGVKFRGINKKEEYAPEHMFSLSENSANKLIKSSYAIDLGLNPNREGEDGEMKDPTCAAVASGGSGDRTSSERSRDSSSALAESELTCPELGHGVIIGGGSGMLDLIKHNRKHLTRIYPKGMRVNSTNYEPHRYWSAGAQLVAINWQTFDIGYMLNHAMFQRNGRSGYVLKPPALSSTGSKEILKERTRHILHIRVISAQQLPSRMDKQASPDPFVEVSVFVPDWANPSANGPLKVGKVAKNASVHGKTTGVAKDSRSSATAPQNVPAGGSNIHNLRTPLNYNKSLKGRVASTDSWVDLGAEDAHISNSLPRRLQESGGVVYTASPSSSLSMHPPTPSSAPSQSILGNDHFVGSPPPMASNLTSYFHNTTNTSAPAAAPNGALLASSNHPSSEGAVIPGKTISYRTGSVKNNGFNPVWEEDLRLPFEVVGDMKELVFVKFTVRLKENSESEEALAVYCISLASLQMGYRHLPLHDAQLSQYLFSTLFVKINIQDLEH